MDATHAYALEGARRALARVTVATETHALSPAAAEASMWLAALDEERGGKDDRSPHVATCRAAEVSDLLQGIRYVRNQATHALARLASDKRPHPLRSTGATQCPAPGLGGQAGPRGAQPRTAEGLRECARWKRRDRHTPHGDRLAESATGLR